MTAALEFNALPDAVLIDWLAAGGHRPNLLIEGAAATNDTAMRHIMTWSALPFRYCALPGRLEVPDVATGTLLLHDVAALTRQQQLALFDWLSVQPPGLQVVSLTADALGALVADGAFLEGLYYRLNVVRLNAVHGTRPAPLDAWRQPSNA